MLNKEVRAVLTEKCQHRKNSVTSYCRKTEGDYDKKKKKKFQYLKDTGTTFNNQV